MESTAIPARDPKGPWVAVEPLSCPPVPQLATKLPEESNLETRLSPVSPM